MDPRLQSSFIPKKPLIENSSTMKRPASTVNLFFLISFIVLIIAVGLAAGIFFFNKFQESSIVRADDSIAKAQAKYDVKSYESFARLDRRLKTSKTILNKHLSVSSIFDLLSKDTVKNVRFSDFKFTLGEAGAPAVVLSGEAKSFNSVSVQSDTFRNDNSVKNPIFSDVHLDDKGSVLFNVTASMSSDLVLFANSFAAVKKQETVQSAGTTTASSTKPN